MSIKSTFPVLALHASKGTQPRLTEVIKRINKEFGWDLKGDVFEYYYFNFNTSEPLLHINLLDNIVYEHGKLFPVFEIMVKTPLEVLTILKEEKAAKRL